MVVLGLGLGLGAATVMVSVINAVFVRPLPFPEPDRIVSVVRYQQSGVYANHSQAAVAHARDNSGAFSTLAGIRSSPGVNLASDRGSRYIRNLEVTAGFFRVLGVEPHLGRAFVRDDETDPSTVVLSHTVWAGHFGGDPDIVGLDVRLGGRPHAVIGVMPPDFWSYDEADAWTPFRPDPRGMDFNYQFEPLAKPVIGQVFCRTVAGQGTVSGRTQRSQAGSDRHRRLGARDVGGSWGLPAGYEGKHARRDVPHFLHEPFQLTVVLDPLPVKDEFVFGEVQADGLSAGLARPVVVGAVTGVRVVVAATGGPPTRYPAGLNAALADEPERLQFRLERVVLLLVPAYHCAAAGHRFAA